MSKKTALFLLTFFDLLSLFVFWLGYNEIKQIFTGIANSVDAISFSNRVGFYSFVVLIPVLHIFAICFYWWEKVLEIKADLINWSVIIFGAVVLVFSIFASSYMRTYVETAGYQHCPGADEHLTFSTYLVYTRDEAVCSRFVTEKRKGYRAANK